jgi:hypothetical protein
MIKLKNQNPSYPVRLFHLTLAVPHNSRRARSLCGFSLREGARYETVEHHMVERERRRRGGISRYINAFIRRRNRNSLQAFKREDYWDHLCPGCLEHPEYVLTLLADLP